ncbi:hypothetical protein Agub_g5950, partial [Astrephomene gubernaculifera]
SESDFNAKYRMTSILAGLAYRYLAWSAPSRCPFPSANGQLPKQTPPISFPIYVYSHRGGNLETNAAGHRFVENTLPAFRNSVALGVDLLELDVQLTRDGQAAVFHDRELGRLCGPGFKGKRIADFSYKDLPRLGCAHSSQGSLKPLVHQHNSDEDDLRIPLLREVFEAHPSIPIQIDLKVPSQQLVNVVNDLVREYRRERLVLWGSFIHTTSNALYAANPSIPLFTSAPRAFLLLAAHSAGRLKDVHIYESAMIIPWRFGYASEGAWWRPSLLLPDFFRELHSRGVSVVLFGGINDEATFEACTAAGAAALCTDHPSRLLRWMAAAARGAPGAAAAGGGGAAAGGAATIPTAAEAPGAVATPLAGTVLPTAVPVAAGGAAAATHAG